MNTELIERIIGKHTLTGEITEVESVVVKNFLTATYKTHEQVFFAIGAEFPSEYAEWWEERAATQRSNIDWDAIFRLLTPNHILYPNVYLDGGLDEAEDDAPGFLEAWESLLRIAGQDEAAEVVLGARESYYGLD